MAEARTQIIRQDPASFGHSTSLLESSKIGTSRSCSGTLHLTEFHMKISVAMANNPASDLPIQEWPEWRFFDQTIELLTT
ncbi:MULTISPECIES: hypothetical protein [unclassified Caballeronia]|uniref:hypothetical protein n=1 Tax=unclassified Caballeronia TaxID=2646786 RepID=UPI00285B3139|nr:MULTISPECIES: hypothetical protein [unclassified Caballeronia]MDR5755179.1 hypothetical protein [Caballeronia sp. LZ024]MDR5845042.1 hypothetical protein [Caballeronia sp. LZ031]